MPQDFENFEKDAGRIWRATRDRGAEGYKKAIKEHDEEMIRRRGIMIVNTKQICQEKSIDPSKLSKKILAHFMAEYPERYFNLQNVDTLLKVYFLQSLGTLKELLFQEPE